MMQFSVSQIKIIISEIRITKKYIIEKIIKLKMKCLLRFLDLKF